MATIKELRQRIRTLKNTGKITAAMKMVSASKLKRAQEAITNARPYTEKMQEIIQRVSSRSEEIDHPLLQVRDVKRVRYYVFTSDKGLCGSFNNGLLRFYDRQVKSDDVTNEETGVGLRARTFFLRHGGNVPEHLKNLSNKPEFGNAQAIADQATRDFLEGEVDRVVLVFNKFQSVLTQKPITLQLLPCNYEQEISAGSDDQPIENQNEGYNADYIFEPDAKTLFGELLPKLVTVQVYRALLENAAGEHGARMTAMDSATNNVKDLVDRLSLQMNRARQAAITTELSEIIGGAEAL